MPTPARAIASAAKSPSRTMGKRCPAAAWATTWSMVLISEIGWSLSSIVTSCRLDGRSRHQRARRVESGVLAVGHIHFFLGLHFQAAILNGFHDAHNRKPLEPP